MALALRAPAASKSALLPICADEAVERTATGSGAATGLGLVALG